MIKYSYCFKFSTVIFVLFSFLSLVLSFNAMSANNRQKFYIEKYGAVNDGKTINTRAIQDAIDEAHKSKGIVVFTKGIFLCGSLILKSDIDLVLEDSSVLLGSTDPDNYKSLDIKNIPFSPKTDDNSRLALLIANDVKNISISGNGIIDGHGRALALVIDSLHCTGKKIDPHYGSRPSETMRPKIINFINCENIRITGITIKNSSCWVQNYELCKNLVIDSIKVISRAYWNNDGIDITDCTNVRITYCDINSGDDGICLKSYYPGHFNDSFYIANCVIRSSCNAVKLGTASIGGFRNITIENNKIYDTGLSAIAIENVDGGFIENIIVNSITAINTGNALFVRLGHRSGEHPGTINNINIQNLNVQVPLGRPDLYYDMRVPEPHFSHNQFPVVIVGIPDQFIEEIKLRNIEISYPGKASKGLAWLPLWRLNEIPEHLQDYPEYNMFGELPSWGFYIRHVKSIIMKNIILKLRDADFRPAMVLDDVENIDMQNITIPNDKTQQIILKNVKHNNLDSNIIPFSVRL